jgi:hypothetical protein
MPVIGTNVAFVCHRYDRAPSHPASTRPYTPDISIDQYASCDHMTNDDQVLHNAFATVRAFEIMTPLYSSYRPDLTFDDVCDPFAGVAALPDTDISPPARAIVDMKAFRTARINRILTEGREGESVPPPQEIDFLRPYVSVRGNTLLVALFGDNGGGAYQVPTLPGLSDAEFWVVVGPDDNPIGTLTPDNLLRLPGRFYLLSRVLRLEHIAAEYCHRLPQLFWNLKPNRQRKIFAQSLNYDRRWHRQLADADESLMDPLLLEAAHKAFLVQNGKHAALHPDSTIVRTALSVLADDDRTVIGRRMAIRLLLESSTIGDRKEMLAHAATLRPHTNQLSRVFDRANDLRNRLAHPFPLMSTSYHAFWDFTESEPLSHESLDEGLDRPLYESWPELLGMSTLAAVQDFSRSIDIVTAILDAANNS